MTATPLLDMIENMDDLRRLPEGELQRLAAELRDATIGAVSKTGGHLGAGLGVVELTVALHYVFQTPHDRLIWDVGHQAYPHKILTGRREQIETLRQKDGLSGFTKRSESSSTRLAPVIPRPRFPPASAWRWAAISPARKETSSR